MDQTTDIPVINSHSLNKSFKIGVQQVDILKDINVRVDNNDFMIIIGPSGCGKSTLLHILLGLEPPTTGKVEFLGKDIFYLHDDDLRADIRKKHIGMVYQQSNWVKSLTVSENVAFPLMLLGMDKVNAMKRAMEQLEKVNMQEWATFVPTELSGGQQQRVSVARALVNNPSLIVADEPTGNLDYAAGQDIMKLLYDLNTSGGKTIVMVTHDLAYLTYSKTAVRMLDGRVVGTYRGEEKEKLMSELQYKRSDAVKNLEGGEALTT